MELQEKNTIIAGRNAVMEAIRAGQPIDTIFVDVAAQGSIGKIKAAAKDAGIVVKPVAKQKLDQLCDGLNHQGAVATLSCVAYAELSDLLRISEEKGTPPFLILLDEIEDPHNLGAILRTADAAGADGVILPKRRSASLTPTVFKTSAGAAGVLPVARVSNLVACIKELKERNIWVYGADMDGQDWNNVRFGQVGTALVIGSEGHGLTRLVKENCDALIRLPMLGQINSLNASVAAGILMYEVVRQRGNA